jgi:hypothetical protein
MQSLTRLLNLACHLHIYLIDSQCSGANWPYLSRHSIPLIQQTSMTHLIFDLYHLLIDLQGQMHSCIRNFSIGHSVTVVRYMGIIPVCRRDRL